MTRLSALQSLLDGGGIGGWSMSKSTNDRSEVRVIIVAEAASARFGGEAILPLHYFRFLRKRQIEAWLVVHSRTRAELNEVLGDEINRVHFVPDLWIHKALNRVAQRLPSQLSCNTVGLLSHLITQLIQRRIVRRLVKCRRATVVHEPVPVSPRTPSFMHGVGAPVVMGPMNGGMDFPPGFSSYQGLFVRVFMKVARIFSVLANRVIRGKCLATTLLVANTRTRSALPVAEQGRVVELVENGVDTSVFQFADASEATVPANARPRFVYIGRLVDWKAVDLLLEAFAQARDQHDMELHIVGDGSIRSELEELSRTLKLEDHVIFRGFLPQAEYAALLQNSDALVLTSLYESGGAVVLEAMAIGLPVIASNWGGPADYLDNDTGILVEPSGGPEAFRREIVRALVRMASEPCLRTRLGQAGRAKVMREYRWDSKIDRILSIYRDAITRGGQTTSSA